MAATLTLPLNDGKPEEYSMTTLKVSRARGRLAKLVDETRASHEPIMLEGKRSSAVLIAEDDWRALQETVYLLSVPGMRESIRKGLKAPVKACAKNLKW